jgi:glycosyltransferase involved in cell wall biosynthesis
MSKEQTIKIGLVIPCYNEANRLPIDHINQFLASDPATYLLFVNDGSRDQTLNKLKNLAEHERVDFLDLKENKGKAEAVRLGMIKMNHLEVDYLGFWDADMATPLTEVTELRRFISSRKESDAILCSRWLRLGFEIKRNPLRHYLGRVFATVASMMLRLPVYDTQCGAKLFNKEAIKAITDNKFVSKWFFDIEILFRLKQAGFKRFWEYPVQSWEDVKGSKLKITDFIFVPIELFKINRHYNHD